ncbi:hypothetical protein M9H77_19199 [Catharanthus roseus]|uniref:Uncharacterized protein n=1 Tax=Catharanthus roseus TaxID=4058 RepID=A0ACC0B9L6_CATRO|nr:hypothetical protein M9H77_19199 [Catharanthus roseus]
MTSKFVSKLISHFAANDPGIPVSNVIQEVQVRLQTGCTYKRACYARKFAIERVFCSWETTFSVLPKYLQAMKYSNSGVVYEFLNHRTSNPLDYVFKFIFWCFSSCINRFQHCRPVISVNGTHLQGPYKGILLIASTWNANNLLERKLSSGNLTTLLHDGGHRHGMMTTNISKPLNSMLKKVKVLPLKTLVELIFSKLVKYFNQYREEAQNCVHPFPTRVFDKFLQIELKSRDHTVTTYDPREGIYMSVEKIVQDQMLMCWIYIRGKLTKEHTNPIFIRLDTRTFGEMLLEIYF